MGTNNINKGILIVLHFSCSKTKTTLFGYLPIHGVLHGYGLTEYIYSIKTQRDISVMQISI